MHWTHNAVLPEPAHGQLGALKTFFSKVKQSLINIIWDRYNINKFTE